MNSFFNRKNSFFVLLIFFLIIVLFLNFLFFYPKFGEQQNYKSLNLLGQKTIEEKRILLSSTLKEGDIVLFKPVSFINLYNYEIQKEHNNIIKNIFIFFFFYNLFDKTFINSMGEEGYWHVYIYTGNETLNSLDIVGVTNEKINEKFLKAKYLKAVRVEVGDELKDKAVAQAIYHEENKDISYSLKNGIIIVFSSSTGIIPFFDLEHNKLVCSSYIAYLYKDINFNKNKGFVYTSPEDIANSELTETLLIINEDGVYIK